MFQINDPCPVNMNQLKKTGNNCYLCAGCKKEVIDFTESTDFEIEAFKGQEICGIFRNDQLAGRPVFHWKNALFFRLLAAASFFGFTVSPVHADELIYNDHSRSEISANNAKKNLFKPKKKNKKKRSRRRTKGAAAYG